MPMGGSVNLSGHLIGVDVQQVRLFGFQEASRDEDHVGLKLDYAGIPGAVGKHRAVEKDFTVKYFSIVGPKMPNA